MGVGRSPTETLTVATSFGPSALATPANAVSIMRLLVTVPFLMLVVDKPDTWPVVTLWLVLCITDGIDGYLARRQGVTRSGAFLDPLADKVLVLGAMVALVAAGRFWWLPVMVIAVRETLISAFRSYWGRRGLAVPATGLAKVKTITQEVAVGFALLPLTADHRWVANGFLTAAVFLTVVTGLQYMHDGSRATRTMMR
jgi:CDP-diacylglycerol--glycerol-3-phosphate 3-phosphatidyltransferase